jgi:hypothetical protein
LIRLRHHDRQLSQATGSHLASLIETRHIRAITLPLLPNEIQHKAARYTRMRQNVNTTHYAVRCLLARQIEDFVKIAQAMGLRDFTTGMFYWLMSANNHLFKPRPTFSPSNPEE